MKSEKQEEKVRKRMFYLHSFGPKDYEPRSIRFAHWIESGELEFVFSRDKAFRHLPEGYDVYILHLSDTSEEAITELRKDQPWSWIYGISGAVTSEPEKITESLEDNLDKIYDEEDMLDESKIESIFKQIQKYRSKK